LEVIVANNTWRFSQRAAVTAVSLLLGTAAQAGLIRGNLDPSSDGVIPAYNGFADFQVDDNCLVGDGWKSTDPGTGDCGVVFMQSASINLYGNTLGDTTSGTLRDTLTFGLFPESSVHGILVQAGIVLGIDSDPMGPVLSTFYTQDFWLQFVTGCIGAPVDNAVCFPPPPGFGSFAASDVPVSVPDPIALLANVNESGSGLRTDTRGLTFRAVPEPGTMGLILGALGGGWLARRRKKKVAA
jgi:hypothetical protein